MEAWLTDRARLAMLLAACTLLASIEFVAPLYRYRARRIRRAIPNLILAIGVVLVNLACASATAWVSTVVTGRNIGLLADMRRQPWALLALGAAGLDLFAYFAHRLMHAYPLGWRFHCVHHSELEVDVTTAFRQHPGESLWRLFWQGAGAAVFGLPFWAVSAYQALSSLNGLLEHANVRMSEGLDSLLRLFIVTPNMHKIHHSRAGVEANSNYSNIFSLWDRICGTYTAHTDLRELRYGLDGFDESGRQRLTELLLTPFRARRERTVAE